MKKIFWVLAAILISTGVYFTIRYGLRPKPIPILNPTQFADPEQIGAVIYRSLRQSLRSEKLIVLGSQPLLPHSAEIWNGFLKTATADGLKVDVFFQWPNLALPTVATQMNFKDISESEAVSNSIITKIHESFQRGFVTIVHFPTIESSHLVADSMTRKLDRVPNNPVISISIVYWPLHSDAEREALSAQCTKPMDKKAEKLSCATYKFSRKNLKKKLDPGKLWAAMERHGLKEYLLFVNQPLH